MYLDTIPQKNIQMSHNADMAEEQTSDFWYRIIDLTEDMTPKERVDHIMGVCDVEQGTVSRWKTGPKLPGRKNLRTLCHHFKVNMDWLELGVGDPYIARDDDPFIRYIRKYLGRLSDDDKDELRANVRYKVLRNHQKPS